MSLPRPPCFSASLEPTRAAPHLQRPSTFGGWLETARYADPSAYVLLKADQNAPYGVVEQIMKELQNQNANRFNIITDAKQKARVAPAAH